MEYFGRLYDREGYATLPRPDHAVRENVGAYLTRPFDFDRESAERACARQRLGKNGLYLLASAMAIAAYNETEDVLITWTWNGRTDARTSRSVGVFFKDLPAAFHIEKEPDIPRLVEQTRTQIEQGVAHGHASYFVEAGDLKNSDLLCLIYQGDLYRYEPDGIAAQAGLMKKNAEVSKNVLDVEVLESEDAFGVMLNYNAARYEPESMERFAALICEKCKQIIAACQTAPRPPRRKTGKK